MKRYDRGIRGESKGILLPIAILVILACALFIFRYVKTSEQRKYGYADYRPGLDAVIGERLGGALAQQVGNTGSVLIVAEVKVGDLENARADTRAAAAQKVLTDAGVPVDAVLSPTTDELRSMGWAGSMTEGMSAAYLGSLPQSHPGVKGIVCLPGYPTTNMNALQPLKAAGIKMVAFDEGSMRRYKSLMDQGLLVAVITRDPASEFVESDFEDLEAQAEEAFGKIFKMITR